MHAAYLALYEYNCNEASHQALLRVIFKLLSFFFLVFTPHMPHTVDGPENINLTIFPSQEYFEAGSNISLICSAVSRPSAFYYWFLNDDLLSDAGPELRLVNIQMSQSGNHSCQAFNNKTVRYETSQPLVVPVLGKLELQGQCVYSNQYLLILLNK